MNIDRLGACPGSQQRALSTLANVGICRACGVRTFATDGIIRPHQTTARDIAELRTRGPRHAAGRR